MQHKEFKIKNRKGLNMVVVVNIPNVPRGLCFVVHGFGGYKEEPHISAVTSALLEKDFAVICYDATNSIGESDGETENATLTSYFEDLEDVVDWSRGQDWYMEPLTLVGHSMGGACSVLYASKYPDMVKSLVLISSLVSGKFFADSGFMSNSYLKNWQKQGYITHENKSKPGVLYNASWKMVEDIQKYDLLRDVNKIKAPVLMIVGELDRGTPVSQQQILFDHLKSDKEFHIIKGAYHNFHHPEHLSEIREILKKWLVVKMSEEREAKLPLGEA